MNQVQINKNGRVPILFINLVSAYAATRFIYTVYYYRCQRKRPPKESTMRAMRVALRGIRPISTYSNKQKYTAACLVLLRLHIECSKIRLAMM